MSILKESRDTLVIRGAIAPVFTAFTESGALDLDGQRRMLDFLVERGGINAFFIRSGMGQMYTFDRDEAERLIECVCKHLQGVAPVLAGCNGIWDRHPEKRPEPRRFIGDAIHLSRFAESCGAAGIVHTVPEALLPAASETMGDLFERYFTDITAAVSTPVIVYQPPGTREAYQFQPETLKRVAALPGVAGAKVSYSDGAYVFDLMRCVTNLEFDYIVGDERIWYAGLYGGAAAVIGQGTILNPQLFNAAQTLFGSGAREAVLEVQDDINLLCRSCTNPQDFLARYATENGYPVTTCLRPSATNPYHTINEPLNDAEYAAFKTLLEAMDGKYSQ